MSRTIHPDIPGDDARWEAIREEITFALVVLRWRDLETVCDTVEYLCVDADPLRESLRHQSGESADWPPRDFTLTREETEQLHTFATEALEIVTEAYDIEDIVERDRHAHTDGSTVEKLSEEELDARKTWSKLLDLHELTEVALELDIRLEVA